MNLYFHVEYHTVFGEQLALNIVSRQGHVERHLMTTSDGLTWHLDLLVNMVEDTVMDYYYNVLRGEKELRHEWLTVMHRLELGKQRNLVVYDHWNDIPEDSYYYSSAFTECVNRRHAPMPMQGDSFVGGCRLRLTVRAPQLRGNQYLAVVGDNAMLGLWDAARAIPMTEHHYNEWVAELDATIMAGRTVELKFIAVDDRGGVLWEAGPNHIIQVPQMEQGDGTVLHLGQAFFAIPDERVAGTLVPVFSLRSKGSFGVGDFGDLRMMVDWMAKTGQRLLQVLPVNDTTATHTWVDSYPYSCISVFALHPIYTDLRQLPSINDDGLRLQYSELCKELNALPQIDYERVYRSKMEYMRIIYEQEGAGVLKSESFKNFFKETEQWLVPYAQYCLLRDKTGTVDFTCWKGHETWNETERKALANPRTKAYKEVAFYYYQQYVLNTQMKAVHEYARQRGVILKGDIPIGVSRVGCDVWMEPKYFNMNGQAGAPPDDFSADGQNWGFPTYNWDEMLKDGCAWWVRRFQNMSRFFDAYRIDHVLGFFRIWEIPLPYESGLMGQFSPALGLSLDEINSWGVYSEIDGLFLVDHKNPEKLHPRIAVQFSDPYKRLPEWEKNAFNRLYDDYFYRRNNQFWYVEAMKKLPRLVEATRMLVCAEDLGMVPDCVQWVMNELRILSLELQSMPKDPSVRFGLLERNPYRSVCTISSHDTPTLRMWWDEDSERTQAYYNTALRKEGAAPHPLSGSLAYEIIAHHLASPSMVCVIALQDWLAINEQLRLADANAERVNIPANPKHYWRYRMHLNIEDLMTCEGFSADIAEMVRNFGR